ncbi:MAG: hypothetical protein JSS78_06900 [Bacteroidetes bacterium]|nr:hypothetical protein [Bacteroidota bacterium]
MRLYPRKLNNVEELKREIFMLQFAAKHSSNDLFESPQKTKEESFASKDSSPLIALLTSLTGSNSLLGSMLSLAPTLISLLPSKSQLGKKTLEGLAKRVLLGYVKWTTIELGYRMIRKIIQAQTKEKSDRRRKE